MPLRSSLSSRLVSSPGSPDTRRLNSAAQRSALCSAAPRSPWSSWVRIRPRQAASCSGSSSSSCRQMASDATGSGRRCSADSNSARACSCRRRRSAASQASRAGSVPFSSSSSTPSSGGRIPPPGPPAPAAPPTWIRAGALACAMTWLTLAFSSRSASTAVSAGRSASEWRSTLITGAPTGARASSRRWISCRSDARACSSERRLHSISASFERSTGRRPDIARIASRPRVLRPGGSTFSLSSVSACIGPTSCSRSSDGSDFGRPGRV